MRPHDSLIGLEDDSIHEQITLGARQGVKVSLGIYEDALSPPLFDIVIFPVPKSGEVKKSVIRSEDKGDYHLIYYFQNFSDQEFTVTVHERSA